MGLFTKFKEAMKDVASGAHGMAAGLLDGTTKGNSIGSLVGIGIGAAVGLATGGLLPAIVMGVGLGAACGIAGGAIIGSIGGAVKNGHSLETTGTPLPQAAAQEVEAEQAPSAEVEAQAPQQTIAATQEIPMSFRQRLEVESQNAGQGMTR